MCICSNFCNTHVIRKLQNVSCKSKRLLYVPNKEYNNSIINIDGKSIKLPIHPITIKKKHYTTPRHQSTCEMLKDLQPTCITPNNGEMICLNFGNGMKNYVIYATRYSKAPIIKNTFLTWNSNKVSYYDNVKFITIYMFDIGLHY